jgi:uncharacterized protein (TIRG00374 family)
MRKTWARLAVITALTAVFLYFFFQSVDWREVYLILRGVDVALFGITLLLASVHLFTRSLRWRYLLIQEKPDVKFSNMFAANAVGFTVNSLFPGRLGELVRPFFLARKEKMRTGFCLGTILVERTFDTLTMCLFLGLFLLFRPLISSRFEVGAVASANLRFWGFFGLGLSAFLLALILSLYFFREKALVFTSRLLKPFPQKASQKVLRLVEEFICGLKFFHSLTGLLLYTLFSFVVWLGIIFLYWVFLLSFHVSLSFFLLIPYVFLTMIGASIPTPGMVGGFHYFSKLGLTALYGLDPNLAVGATIVMHAVQIVVTALIGYAILWREGMSIFQLKKLGETSLP